MTAAQARIRPAVVERRDQLTGQVCAVLSRWDCHASPSKVARVVHKIARQIADPWFLADRIAAEFVRQERQRRIVADELRRVVPWADITGETAVRNVMKERGY